MSHILHLDASARAERSISRTLSYEFLTAWKDAHSDDALTYRDLGHQSISQPRGYSYHKTNDFSRDVFGGRGFQGQELCSWWGMLLLDILFKLLNGNTPARRDKICS